jgi:hypothetical protein
VVKANHYSLKYLLDQCLAAIPQHQWVGKLMGFDFRVVCKPGAYNIVADALSRRESGADGQLMAVSAPIFWVFDDLCIEIEETAALRQLKEEVLAGKKVDKWQIIDGLM